MCIVFGLKYSEQIEQHRPVVIKKILERAGLYIRWGNLVSLGSSMRNVLAVRTHERVSIPERPWMSPAKITHGLLAEVDQMRREFGIVCFLGVKRAAEVRRLQQVTTVDRLLEDADIRCHGSETEEFLWAILEEIPALERYVKLV